MLTPTPSFFDFLRFSETIFWILRNLSLPVPLVTLFWICLNLNQIKFKCSVLNFFSLSLSLSLSLSQKKSKHDYINIYIYIYIPVGGTSSDRFWISKKSSLRIWENRKSRGSASAFFHFTTQNGHFSVFISFLSVFIYSSRPTYRSRTENRMF
jgi:hypothetical protein